MYMYLLVHNFFFYPLDFLPCSKIYKPICLPIASEPPSLNTQPFFQVDDRSCFVGRLMMEMLDRQSWGEAWWSFVGEDTSILMWLFWQMYPP